MKPMTAAEALKQSKSKSKKVVHQNDLSTLYSFSEADKVWIATKGAESQISYESSRFFAGEYFLPYSEPEIDTELEEAKKLVGTWVKKNYAESVFKVKEFNRYGGVIHVESNTDLCKLSEVTPVWVSEPRCCVEDPPKMTGRYLVIDQDGVPDCYNYNAATNIWTGGLTYERLNPIRWYALPEVKR